MMVCVYVCVGFITKPAGVHLHVKAACVLPDQCNVDEQPLSIEHFFAWAPHNV